MTVVDTAAPTDLAVRARRDRAQLVLGGIVIAQAIWLWIVIGRGWYLQADFSNLADGVGQPLSWSYLSEPLGGHFGPVLRLTYWLLDRIGALDYAPTIALRVGLQAVSTVLLYRVLRLLRGPTGIVLVVTGLYAFNPILLAGLTWMTSGLALVLGQTFALAAVEMHLHYGYTGKLRFAAAAGLLLALATVSADQWVVAVLIPPILSGAYIYEGSARQRVREFAGHWRAWLLTLLPIAAGAVLAIVLADTKGSGLIGLSDAYRLLRNEWLRAIGPTFIGGTWSWLADPHTYVAFLRPPDEVVILGQVAFVVLVLLGLQRNGWRSLLAWLLPISTGVASILLVGIGRYGTSELLIAITPRYSFQVMAPLAMAVVLALRRPEPATDGRDPVAQRTTMVLASAIAIAGVACVSIASGARFTHYWAKNPGRDYTNALVASARAAGPNVNIYDTPVPPSMISIVEPHHHVSDLLRLAHVPARFNDARSEPLVAASDGHLANSAFFVAATAAAPMSPNCGAPIRGIGTWTVNLSKPLRAQEWFLRVDLYQAVPSTIEIEVVDRSGKAAPPAGGSRIALSTLEVLKLRLPLVAPVAIRIRSDNPAMNLCLVHIRVGGIFAVPGRVR